MIPKCAKFITVFFLIFLISGCETSKSVARGVGEVGSDLGLAFGETIAGAAKDTHTATMGVINFIEFLDTWVKDHLW